MSAPFGITPADAGKTVLGCYTNFQRWDHPRRCGENSFHVHLLHRPKGSPPQMRGKQLSSASEAILSGITPADAGKTKTPTLAVLLERDHPRRCGENSAQAPFSARFPGSPPQMRGKLACHDCTIQRCRITPADAGKTLLCCCRRLLKKDHPRRCGENRQAVLVQ